MMYDHNAGTFFSLEKDSKGASGKNYYFKFSNVPYGSLLLSSEHYEYTQKLLYEVGFQKVKTYGDFQETYTEDEPDYFIHVAQK